MKSAIHTGGHGKSFGPLESPWFFQSVPPFYALYFVFSTMHIANTVYIYFCHEYLHICVCFSNIFLTIKALRSYYYDPNVGGALF